MSSIKKVYFRQVSSSLYEVIKVSHTARYSIGDKLTRPEIIKLAFSPVKKITVVIQ